MGVAAICFSVLLSSFVVGFSLKKGNPLQALPTITWFALMVLPFIFSWNFFPVNARMVQSIGILVITIALSLGDFFAIRYKAKQVPTKFFSVDQPTSTLIWYFSGLVLLIPLFHYIFAGSIPLFDQVFRNASPNSVSAGREDFVKLLNVPYLVKVLFNWVPTVFGPICVTWFWMKNRYLLSIGFFLWVVLYSVTSSASGPIVLFLWTLSFALSYAFVSKRIFSHLVVIGISSTLMFCVVSGVWLGSTAIKAAPTCLDSSFKTFTPGDVFRGCQSEPGIWINPVVNRAGYRIFLTPVEVSNHWYDYFDGNPSQKRSFLDIFERTNSEQASNKVGVWAYTDRFPGSYGKTISANGSIDADANSIAGIPAVLVASMLLFLFRVLISISFPKDLILMRILEGIGLAQLAYMPISASLQAILLPQGLGFILFLLLVFRGKSLWSTIRSKVK
jgi:hypothetical protein